MKTFIVDEHTFNHLKALIDSMTLQEAPVLPEPPIGEWFDPSEHSLFQPSPNQYFQDVEGKIPAKAGDRVALLISEGESMIQPEMSKHPLLVEAPDKFAELKEAHANGAVIQFYSKLYSKWCTPDDPAWDECTEYRIDPTWRAEQDERLYAWDVYSPVFRQWFRHDRYLTTEVAYNKFNVDEGFRHIRGQEFIPPKDEK